MDLLTYMILGLVAGWLAAVLMGRRSSPGLLMDSILGMIGAILGGFIMNYLGSTGLSGVNSTAIAMATLASVVFIWIGRKITGEVNV